MIISPLTGPLHFGKYCVENTVGKMIYKGTEKQCIAYVNKKKSNATN
jgi:hypothetical protein